MSKLAPQSSVYRISINQQQLDQIVAALKANPDVTSQVDSNYDQTDVFFVSASNTADLLDNLNRESAEDKARCHYGLCL